MDRGAILSSEPEHFHDFPVRCARRVVHAHAFGERALPKPLFDHGGNLGEFLRGRSTMRSVARGKHAGLRVAHHFHADGNVADAYAEIDERLPFPSGVPAVHVVGAGFELEGCGDAIAGLELVIARFLAMFVEVDETGSDDEPFGFDGRLGV